MSHVMIKIRRAGRRINDSQGSAGRTLCGAEITDRDLDMAEAKKDVRDGDHWLTCESCRKIVERMIAEDRRGAMKEIVSRETSEKVTP